MKRLIGTVVAAAIVTLGSVGVAAAQTDGATDPSTPAAHAAQHRGGHRHAGFLRVVAQTLGLQPRAVVSGLCDGKTIAQLASEHGKSGQDVIRALVAAVDQRLDRAVTAGRLDAAQAAQRKGRLEARITRLVNDFHASGARCQRLAAGAAGPPTGNV